MRKMGRLDNFGIRRVERLDGNIGYLDLRRMPDPANAGPAISAAMELVAGTCALIIDMRHNGGGAPEGVVFWCSYLFDGEPTHLNDIFRADTGETRQFWALPYVPGTRYPDQPVYVLTSERTFSGGEDLCYTLQALGRAQVIGETTGGGAHPTRVLAPGQVDRIGVFEVPARDGADAVRPQEPLLIQHPGQDAPQLVLVHQRQQSPPLDAGHERVGDVGQQVLVAPEEGRHVLGDVGIAVDHVGLDHRGGAQRQQPHQGPDLHARTRAVGQTEHVVEEAVLLVPHLVRVFTERVYRGRDPEEISTNFSTNPW
jgi:hypothetical protein